MRIGILSGGDGWHVRDLLRAAAAAGHAAERLDFRTRHSGQPADDFDGYLVRTMPAGSLEQVVFRMDLLHAAAAAGVPVLNPPRAVETCVDKYLTDVRLAAAKLPVPRTRVCQTAADALLAFADLGGDVVVKPLFGSEGRGMVRVADAELAWRTFHAIDQTRGVLYLQEFVPHPGWDLRLFVVRGSVVAAMKRTARGDWRTNVAQGGAAEDYAPTAAEVELAVRAAAATGAVVAGVDLLPHPGGVFVIEVNAVPGWRALAAACNLDVAKLLIDTLADTAR